MAKGKNKTAPKRKPPARKPAGKAVAQRKKPPSKKRGRPSQIMDVIAKPRVVKVKPKPKPKRKPHRQGASKPITPTGRMSPIGEVVEKFKKNKLFNLPIYTFSSVSYYAGVTARTIQNWFYRGREEFGNGIQEYNARKKTDKGSLYVTFFHMIDKGRSGGDLRAMNTIMRGVDEDPKIAVWWMRTRYPEIFGEVQKIETRHTGGLTLTAIAKRAKEYAKSKEQSFKLITTTNGGNNK